MKNEKYAMGGASKNASNESFPAIYSNRRFAEPENRGFLRSKAAKIHKSHRLLDFIIPITLL
jgi:hypothetical protein